MTPEQENEYMVAINQTITRAQLDAIKTALNPDQKEIYNQVMIAQKNAILKLVKGLPKAKLEEIENLYDKALLQSHL